MKSILHCLAILGVLLLTASPTVKAGKPVTKPEETKSTPVKVIQIVGSTNVFLFTTSQLLFVASTAMPSITFTDVAFHSPASGIYWLQFKGYDTDSFYQSYSYFPLSLNGQWYELDEKPTLPISGRCSGWCDPTGNYESCFNTSTVLMVRCECSNPPDPNDDEDPAPLAYPGNCGFEQYPAHVQESIHNHLEEIAIQ